MSLDTEYASASASIREVTPSTSDPESQFIRLDGAANEIRALVDVEHGVPPGQDAVVLTSDFKLYKAATFPSAVDVTFKAIDEPWDPYTATWDNQPAVRATTVVVTVPTGGAIGDEITVDLSTLVAPAVAADDASGSRWYGVQMTADTSGAFLFYSPGGPEEYRPKLERDFSVPPDAPSDLIPNDQVVSETSPLLTATWNDADADDIISAIEVEIDTTDDFASPVYDSGKLSHTEASFDLDDPPAGAPAFTPFSTATTYYWRMRVWDNHDLVSDWSETASLEVVAKGTLALTSPAGATVDTPTPTITHTFSGTQDEIEVEIEHFEDGIWFTHWELPRHVSSSLSHTVPDDYALEEGETYRVSVRVWDDESRASTAGDLSYEEDSQEFVVSSA